MTEQIYLGKAGQTYGPYTEAQFESMRERGETTGFTWIWTSRTNQWAPLETPPDLPQTSPAAPSPPPADSVRAPAGAQAARRAPGKFGELEAVCHNHLSYLNGRLTRVTETECDFTRRDTAADPLLALRSPVILNLLDPGSGRSMSVRGKLTGVSRAAGQWVYRIRWETIPEIIR